MPERLLPEWGVLTLLVLIAIFTLHYWFRNRKLPPGPYGLPIVGYLPFINPSAPYETLTKLSEKYGPIYGLHLGNVYTVVLSDVKLIKKVLAKDATTGRAPLYLTHGIMKGYGLICAQGDLWKDQRKFAASCLRQFGIIRNSPRRDKVEALIVKEADDFISFVNNNNHELSEGLDVLEPLRHAIGSIMNQIVFGKIWQRDDETWKWLQHLQEEGTKHIGVAGPLNFLPFLRFVPKFRKTLDFLLDGKHETHKIYEELIKVSSSQLSELKEIQTTGCENIIEAFLLEREKRKDSPDLNNFYNDQQFYHLLADMFGAGLDTTLTTLRWYLLYMAINKDFQQKLQEELDAVLDNGEPRVANMVNLPLLEASLSEAQRIRSVVPIGIPHGCLEDVEIEGFVVPKNSMVVPLQWAVHMNAKIWSNPNSFDPLRFIDEECRYVRSEHLIPFQTGKRMCIGDELARMLLLLFAAKIFQKFSVRLEEKHVDLSGECGITLTPPAHKLIFSSRNGFAQHKD